MTPAKNGIIVMYTFGAASDFPIDASAAMVTMRPKNDPLSTLTCTLVTARPDISNATLGKCYFMVGGLGNDIYIWNVGAFAVGQHIRYKISGLQPKPGGTGTFQDFDSETISGPPAGGPTVVAGRIPARLVLVLDKSGSMAWSSHPLDPGCAVEAPPPPGCEPARWTVLKTAVTTMLRVASAYSISVDEMAVAPFSDVVPLSAIGVNFLTQDLITQTSTLVNSTLSPGGWTSIGAGLEKYEPQIQPVPPNTRNQLVLLFTDGDQNRPPFVVFNGEFHMQINATPDLSGSPREYAAPTGTPPGNTDTAKVCPFALRADGPSVLGTMFIDGIASRRCQGMGMTKVSINPDEPALMQWFLQTLNRALIGDKLEVAYVNRDSAVAPVPLPPPPFAGVSAIDSFTISARDGAFTVLLTVANQNQKITPVYLTKDGQTFDLTGGPPRPGIKVEQGAGFLTASLSAPFVSSAGKKVTGKGTWKIQIGQVMRGTQRYNLFVNVDNQTIATDFTAVQPTPGVGHPLVLTARLIEGGVPITGLPSGSVRAIVSGPTSGLGNVLSSAQIAPLPVGSNDTMNAAARKANAMLANASLRPAILAALLAHLTPVTTLQEVSGSPGTYQANYTMTNAEGIYEVTFLADFQTTDNGRVTRTFSVTRYIPVTADQPATQSTVVTTPITPCSYPGGCFSVTLQPKDNLGNLVGPGKTPLLFIPSNQGVLLAPTVDNLNGTYTLRVGSYRPAGTPVVVHYGNTPIGVQPPGHGGGGGVGWGGGLVVVLPYVGITVFQDTLHLKNGPVVGARIGYRVANHVTVQADAGATFTKTTTNRSGRMIQLLGSVRWDLESGDRTWGPGVTLGVGYALFRGFGVNDEALLYRASAGATYKFGPKSGLRFEAAALRIADVLGAGTTTNYQATVGLVWWF